MQRFTKGQLAGRRGKLHSPQGLKPHSKQCGYRSAEALRHPKAKAEPGFTANCEAVPFPNPGLWVLLAATTIIMMIVLAGCGSNGSQSPQQGAALAGNWQFTMAPQTDGNSGDPTFNGGLQGGFLLQNNASVTGQTVYSVALAPTPDNTNPIPCNSGTAPVTVTISGQNVTITEAAGTQTYTLTGTLSADGSTMMGTYTSTAGTAADGSPCGYAETGLSWSAVSVPPLAGTVQGFFHSQATEPLTNQDFSVSGTLAQGENVGASNATITGTLTFVDPVSNLNGYPCFSTASVNGQISGNTVVLQIIGTNGSAAGQIGGTTSGMNPVALSSTPNGYVLQNTAAPGYAVNTKACSGSGLGVVAGDSGNICLALNNTTGCQQPITLSPAPLTFPAQQLGAPATTQTITLTNVSGQQLDNLTLSSNQATGFFTGQTDFTSQPNFMFTDNCGAGGVPSNGNGFSLGGSSPTSCLITVTFTPQESCAWLPSGSPPQAIPPAQCPVPLTASLTVNSPASADKNTTFAVPITGIALSAVQASTPELDFGAEEPLNPPEASLPQTLTFTNNSANPVQILGRPTSPCTSPLPRPLQDGSAKGLQTVCNGFGCNVSINADFNTITYECDIDSGTLLSNFQIQISSDSCTGTLLAAQASCSLQIAYVPQPNTNVGSGGLDYFLELNTLQCSSPSFPNGATADCEVDSGRFPVELKANGPSPLRMSPGAGLNFGNQKHGTTSAPMTITLLNDPNLTSPQTVTFIGRISAQGNYAETDDCPATLAPGSSCTLSVTFTPSGAGFQSGTLRMDYTQASSSRSPNTGNPQFVQLRGTGQ